MPIAFLGKAIRFPDPSRAEPDGLLAVGGDLSAPRLLAAYAKGIFPWYSDGSPILWWSPDPRLVLLPEDLVVSRSLRQVLRRGLFRVTFNAAFEEVIQSCAASTRRGQDGTWITDRMIAAYTELHRKGHALSVEAWLEGKLAGGLYGILLGQAFFGESMFARESNASKVCLAEFSCAFARAGGKLIDCQVTTEHLLRMGAREISRDVFLSLLSSALRCPRVSLTSPQAAV